MILLSISKIPFLHSDRFAQAQPYGIFTMNIVIFPIQSLIEIHGRRLPELFGVILQKGVPMLVVAIMARPYLVPIQKEPLLALCLRHGFMHEGFIRCQEIVLWHSVAFLHLLQVMVAGIRSEMVRFLRMRFEAEPSVIVEMRFCDCLQCIHEIDFRGLFGGELARGWLQSFRVLLFLEVDMLEGLPPVVGLADG